MSVASRFLQAPGVRSSERRERMTLVAQDRDRRMKRRFEVARIADAMTRDHATLTDIQAHLRTKVRLGELEAPVPSASAICELRRRWELGDRTVEAYADRPRSGRPRKPLDARLWQVVRESILLGDCPSRSELHRRVRAKAVALNLPDPGRRAVVNAFEREPLRVITSFAGPSAAQRFGFAHPSVPAKQTHRCWVVDEFELPIWVKIFLAYLGVWKSAKLSVVVVIDACSRAILAALLVDPTRRRHPETGAHMERGFDQHDVLGALLSASCRELAREATANLAGYLPHMIRWDNAQPHMALRDALIDRTKTQVRRLPLRRPQNRGRVERPIGTLKDWMCQLTGFDERWYPVDQANAWHEHQRQAHAEGAGAVRQPRNVIAVEALMDVAEAQCALDDIVRRYNTEHRHRKLGGLTPAQAYRKHMPRDPRAGRTMLQMLDLHHAFVSRDGIAHAENGWAHQFAFTVGSVMLMPGHVVEYRADPLGRGIFANVFNDTHFLQPLDIWSAKVGGRHMGGIHSAAVSVYAEQARAAREAASGAVHEAAGVEPPQSPPRNRRRGRSNDDRAEQPGPTSRRSDQTGDQASAPSGGDAHQNPGTVPERPTRPSRRQFLVGDPVSQVRPAPPSSDAARPLGTVDPLSEPQTPSSDADDRPDVGRPHDRT